MDKENKYNIETVIFEYNKKDKEFEMFLNSIFRDYINNDKIIFIRLRQISCKKRIWRNVYMRLRPNAIWKFNEKHALYSR